jgi:acyl dehydratase
MPINPTGVLGREFEPVRRTITPRDCMLYALSVGVGTDPVDEDALRFVYEKDLRALATQATVIGHPGDWIGMLDCGITKQMLVHAATRMWLKRPLPTSGEITGRNRVVDLVDKGERGAIIVTERRILDDAGAEIAVIESSNFCRADGGFGGKPELDYEYEPCPEGAPDLTIEAVTRPDAALIYRLNGDFNPLHADPAFARRAGFERPILHGLCTYGATAWAVLKALDPSKDFTAFQARFSKPVTPGETLSIDVWKLDGGAVAFRARVGERLVLDRGRATIGSP